MFDIAMASEGNLYDTLRAGEIDSAELSEIALWHFGGARDTSPTEVVFGKSANNETYALKFVYEKQKQALRKVLAGPSLTAEDLDAFKSKIDLELQQPAALKIATQVLFTRIPVAGWFRYRDVFQILPVPAGAPCGNALSGEDPYPFLVQFKFRPSSSVSMLQGYRQAAEGRKIQLLLNSLLETSVSRLQGFRHHWVLTRIDPKASVMTTEYRQEMYDFPEFHKLRDCTSFTSVDGIASFTGIEPQEYYTRQIVINDPKRFLEIPVNLEGLLDRFFSSSVSDQDRFLRACFWFDHARIASTSSDSAAFTALISAIESLIPDDKAVGQCPVCQRPMKRGSTRRLADFLDHFAPASPKFQEACAKLYYEFRSRLSHGGGLSFSDRRSFFAGLTPEAIEERALAREVWQLVRIVLVNWLHSRCKLLVSVHRG